MMFEEVMIQFEAKQLKSSGGAGAHGVRRSNDSNRGEIKSLQKV